MFAERNQRGKPTEERERHELWLCVGHEAERPPRRICAQDLNGIKNKGDCVAGPRS